MYAKICIKEIFVKVKNQVQKFQINKKEPMSTMSEQPVNNYNMEGNFVPPHPPITPKPPKKKSKGLIIGIIGIIVGILILNTILLFSLFVVFGNKDVRDIERLPEEIIMIYDEQYQLEPNIIPERAKCEITYAINDTKYAEIDENGLVTAKAVQGSATIMVTAGEISKTVQLSVYAPIDAEALEESYKSAKNLLDIVNSDTSINHDDVAEAKNNMQQTFDIINGKDIEIEDISEQNITVLAILESKDAIDSKTQLLLEAYEYAWDIVEQNQAKAAAAKKKKTTSSKKSYSGSSTVKYCSVCGDTSHTRHPSCVVCGSTSHSKHPVCPICASTTHTKHPQ